MAEIRIWCRAYRPFIMGGDVNADVYTVVEAEGPFELGKGHQGYVVTSPKGTVMVVEALTGGIVGDTLEEVRAQVEEEQDDELVKTTLEKYRKRGLTAEYETPEVFFNQWDRGTHTK